MTILHIDSSLAGDASVTRRMTAAIVAGLKAGGDEAVIHHDLAKVPVAVFDPYAGAPDFTLIDEVLAADVIVIGAPMYNFTGPAMLKGWIDRVLVSGTCYGGLRFYDRGGLAGKRALLSFSLGGQQHMFADEAAVHGAWEPMLRPLQRGTLAYVGMQVLPPFAAYHVPYISAEARGVILDQYRDYLLRLESIEPLRFPSLADFDRGLHPLRPEVPA